MTQPEPLLADQMIAASAHGAGIMAAALTGKYKGRVVHYVTTAGEATLENDNKQATHRWEEVIEVVRPHLSVGGQDAGALAAIHHMAVCIKACYKNDDNSCDIADRNLAYVLVVANAVGLADQLGPICGHLGMEQKDWHMFVTFVADGHSIAEAAAYVDAIGGD